MKLLFADKIASWLDSFDVFDEIGRKLFRVEARKSGKPRRLKVYAAYLHNKSVATLKESFVDSAVEIKHGTRYVSAVKKARFKIRKLFDLGFLNWCAVGDFEKGAYTILDGNDRTVATVGETYFNREPVRCIETLPEFTLHSLTFALAIDVQLSDPPDPDPLALPAIPALANLSALTSAFGGDGLGDGFGADAYNNGGNSYSSGGNGFGGYDNGNVYGNGGYGNGADGLGANGYGNGADNDDGSDAFDGFDPDLLPHRL